MMIIRCLIALVFALLVGGACVPQTSDWGDGDADGDADGDSDGDGDGDGDCSGDQPWCSSDGSQVLACVDGEVREIQTCPEGQLCSEGSCGVRVCDPGEVECVDNRVERVCLPTGFAWEERPCGEELRCIADQGCATPCTLRVFILLDQSGSMGGEEGSTKWAQAREALAELMDTATGQPVEFGLGVFPTGDSCGTAAQLVYPIPEATVENVDDYFTSNSPSGSTPLYEALNWHLEDRSANLNDPAYANFILLVSDGSDTCWEDNCIAECGIFNVMCIINCENEAEQEVIRLLGESSARLRDEAEIRTFVIGFGSGVSDEELTAIAENGGTVLGDWLSASNVSELSAAFDTVLDEMLECNPIVY